MKELKVGERVIIEVVEQSIEPKEQCEGCCFNEPEYGCYKFYRIFGFCVDKRRSDGKSVIFKEVKE